MLGGGVEGEIAVEDDSTVAFYKVTEARVAKGLFVQWRVRIPGFGGSPDDRMRCTDTYATAPPE